VEKRYQAILQILIISLLFWVIFAAGPGAFDNGYARSFPLLTLINMVNMVAVSRCGSIIMINLRYDQNKIFVQLIP
jgi:hypothetical protein